MAWIELNATNPAPPAGAQNVHFRTDSSHLGTEDDPLPTSAYLGAASASALGIVKGDGDTLTIDGSGKISVARGVASKTANYTATAADNGKLLVFNSASALTLTLPTTVPASTWAIFVQNIGAGALSISPGAFQLDGSSSSLSVGQNQGTMLASDGSNYFSERGMGSSGGGGMTNPMTAAGDLIVGGSGGTPARLGAGTAGNVLTSNGAGVAPSYQPPSSGGGAPFFQLTDPTAASLSWVNQGSGGTAATETVGTKNRYLYCPPRNAVSIVGRQLAASAPPFSLSVGLIPVVLGSNFLAAGIYVSDGTKFVNIQLQASGGLGVYKYSSTGAFSASYNQPGSVPWSPIFMKIVDDGTNLKFWVGGTGQDWMQILSTTRLDYLSAVSYMGVFVNAQNPTYGVGINVISLLTGTS